MSYKEFYESYHLQYTPKPIKKNRDRDWKQKIAYGVFLVLIIGMIILFTR